MELELYDALGHRKVSNAPPQYLMGDEVGYTKVTTAWSSVVTVAATDYALSSMTMTIIGDGVNETLVTAKIHGVNPGTVVGIHNIRLWDGAVGSGTLLDQVTSQNPTSGLTSMPMPPIITRIPPFLGSKTLNLAYYTAAGGTVPTIHAGATYPAEMRATRLKGAGVVGVPSVSVTAPLVSGAAQMATGGDTLINTWQTLEWDNTNGLMFKAATPDRLFAPEPGIYDVSQVLAFSAGVSSTATLYCFVRHYNAGGTLLATRLVNATMWANAAATSWVGGPTELNMAAGDYVTFYGAQFTGGTRTFNSAMCRFQLSKKAPNIIAGYEQTDTGWLALPTLAGSWVVHNAGSYPLGYRRKNGIVYLRGLIKSGSGLMFTLPAGFRPAYTKYLPAVANDAAAGLYVAGNGQVTHVFGSNVWFSLDNITFPADQ